MEPPRNATVTSSPAWSFFMNFAIRAGLPSLYISRGSMSCAAWSAAAWSSPSADCTACESRSGFIAAGSESPASAPDSAVDCAALSPSSAPGSACVVPVSACEADPAWEVPAWEADPAWEAEELS